MVYYNLNTAQSSDLPKPEQQVVESVRPLTVDGGDVPGAPGFRVELKSTYAGGSVFIIFQGRVAVIFCALAWEPEAESKVWRMAEGCFLDYFDTFPELSASAPPNPEKPASLPWFAVGVPLWPFAPPLAQADVDRLLSFSKSLAWAIVGK